MRNIKHVLFVCSGNSCRSVMAEAYLKKLLEKEGIEMDVRSAGTLGIEGLPPTRETFMVLAEEGINPNDHLSKAVTEDFIAWADIVLVMEPFHRTKLLAMAPGAESKVKYLADFSTSEGERRIPDPIGRPLDFYKGTFDYIKDAIEGFVKWLKE